MYNATALESVEIPRRTREHPIRVAGGVNLYQYVGNNPASYTDPFGLTPHCPPCAAAAAAALAGAAIDVGIQLGINAATDRPLGDNLGRAAATGAAAGVAGFGVGRLISRAATGGRALTRTQSFTSNQLNAFERQLAEHGERSLLRSQRSLQRRLGEHLGKLDDITAAGGNPGSVEREIRNFRSELAAIEEILNRGN